jgi:hypothetical protein
MNMKPLARKFVVIATFGSSLLCSGLCLASVTIDCSALVQVQTGADPATAQAACKAASASDYGVTCLTYAADFYIDTNSPEPLMSIAKDCNQITNTTDLECVQVDIYSKGSSVHAAAANCSILLK